MNKPSVQLQGRVIAEPDGEGGWLLMFPTGDIEAATSRATAERKALRWFRANVDAGAMGVGFIEWRAG
jgi:hypothetical protein